MGIAGADLAAVGVRDEFEGGFSGVLKPALLLAIDSFLSASQTEKGDKIFSLGFLTRSVGLSGLGLTAAVGL